MKKALLTIVLSLVVVPSFAQLVIRQQQPTSLEKERKVTVKIMDYRPYMEEGFFISPDSYYGAFNPVADLSLTIEPKTTKVENRKKISDPTYTVEPEDVIEIIRTFVEMAKEMGANGVVNFKVTEVVYSESTSILFDVPISRYVVEGFCIERIL